MHTGPKFKCKPSASQRQLAAGLYTQHYITYACVLGVACTHVPACGLLLISMVLLYICKCTSHECSMTNSIRIHHVDSWRCRTLSPRVRAATGRFFKLLKRIPRSQMRSEVTQGKGLSFLSSFQGVRKLTIVGQSLNLGVIVSKFKLPYRQ